jgi:hypothetical protein
MKPGGGRAKGASFERRIAKALSKVFPNARRGFQFRGGSDAPDIIGCDPWCIECKVGRRAKKPEDALAQCEADAAKRGDNRSWCVAICQEDRRAVMVYMRAETLVVAMYRDCFPKGYPQAGIVVSMSLEDFILLADGRK